MEKSVIQHSIEAYWSAMAPYFSTMIQQDLNLHGSSVWLQTIVKHAPKRAAMDVLDVGAGPGFFSIILSKAGNRVIGIDCSGEMLKEARANADARMVNPLFLKMDSHSMGFPDNCFDLVVSRDVTWNLYDPEEAYKEWKRVLRPGGRILIFDAHYGRYCVDGVHLKYMNKLFLSDKLRPAWDISALSLLGMDVYTDTDVDRELYTSQDKRLHAAEPRFMVAAEKRLEVVKSTHTFCTGSWNITQTKIRWD
ncbi:MAG: class I SAM-dependent methyltransferase [Treponema sp.]|jgi:ubiquinone/menaquinone biosynthesis C-methylase UbiE|nr:class I SAM-dependent methyltransferase [Treponema sp.]